MTSLTDPKTGDDMKDYDDEDEDDDSDENSSDSDESTNYGPADVSMPLETSIAQMQIRISHSERLRRASVGRV